MWLTRLSIYRPIFVAMAVVILCVLGLRAYFSMPAEMDPRVEIPLVTVVTVYPGAGPEAVEQEVTRPLENAVGSQAGVTKIISTSQESLSLIEIELELGTNLGDATADIRDKVEMARRELPEAARAPLVSKVDLNARPVVTLALSGALPPARLRALADTTLRYELSQLPGVAAVEVSGGRRREIQVLVDRNRLANTGLTIDEVIQSLQAGSADLPAGRLEIGGPEGPGGQELEVRLLGEFRSLEEIGNTQILSQSVPVLSPQARAAGGAEPSAPPLLTVSDVAEVIDTTAEPREITRINGKDSVTLEVTKLADANTVEVADRVRERLQALQGSLPSGLEVSISRDQSVPVREALSDINTALLLGSLLAVVVVFLFLHNLRATLIIALSIPSCILITFLVMQAAGFTLNQMTLLALSLSVGILVDDSILVLESITRHLHRGEMPREAALNGRSEIGLADAMNTFVDVVVFVPIAFMGGLVGQYFRQFGLTIATATLTSLYVSFSLTPMLCARWLRPGERLEARQGALAWFDGLYRGLERRYRRLLAWALQHRAWVVAVGFGALALALAATLPFLDQEFIPGVDEGRLRVTVEMAPGTSLAASDALARRLEKVALTTPAVRSVATEVGVISGGYRRFPERGPQYLELRIGLDERPGVLRRLLGSLLPGIDRGRPSDEEVAGELRRRLETVPSARIAVTTDRGRGSEIAPFQLELTGSDLNALSAAAQKVERALRRIPGVVYPDLSLRTGKPELQVRVDRDRARLLRVPVGQVAQALRNSLEGNTDLSYQEAGRRIPLRVQYRPEDRTSEEDLGRLVVANRPGGAIRLAEVAEVTRGAGPQQILRQNRQRLVLVTASLGPDTSLEDVQQGLRPVLRSLPRSIGIFWGGEAEDIALSVTPMLTALLLAVIFVYALMAGLFNSLIHPFTIMLSLPMALVGALIALALFGESLSVVVMIGVIMLVGLVAKNAILLVDYTNTLRARGMPRDRAILEAGPTRLRPILMTTLSTVLAMLPIALKLGQGSEIRSPMAITVIGGLLLSTLLTLVVIPVMYTFMDELRPAVLWTKPWFGFRGSNRG